MSKAEDKIQDHIITIEKVVYGGKGLSRDLEQVVFVPYTLPGEKVRVQIRKRHRDYLEADPTEIVEPSPNRVPPDCRYYGRCGGCQMSHASYKTQIEMKLGMLKEALQRNKISFPSDIQVITGPPFGYRHRAQLKLDSRGGRIGFYETESNQIVDIKECLCLTPALNKFIQNIRSLLIGTTTQVSEVHCYENDSGETAAYFNAPLPEEIRNRLSKTTLILDSNDTPFKFRFRDAEFPMHPDFFLQVNPKLFREMVQEVEGHYKKSDRTAAELYCGTGFFTVPLSRLFQKIYACEENPKAIDYAREHFQDPKIEWINKKAEAMRFPQETSVLIADPPRAGLKKSIIDSILIHSFESISYISCDAASFSRDLKLLSPEYRLERITLIDLFPQTYHFETIAKLNRSAVK